MAKPVRNLLGAAAIALAAVPAIAQPSGTYWRYLGPGILGLRTVVAVDPTDANLVYLGSRLSAGIHVSRDGGATWHADGYGLGYPFPDPGSKTLFKPKIEVIAFDPSDSQVVYLGTNRGLYKRSGPSEPWVHVYSPGTFRTIESIAICASDPDVIYVGAKFDGVFKTTDGGATWSNVQSNMLYPNDVYGLLVDPNDPKVAIVADSSNGVYTTTDGGAHWTERITDFIENSSIPHFRELVRDPAQPQKLYVATSFGLYRSTNGGANWSRILDTDVDAIAIDPTDSQKIYVGPDPNGFVLRTVNGGAHWDVASVSSSDVTLAVAPTSPNVVYAGVRGGLKKSIDGGAHFDSSGLGLDPRPLEALATDGSAPGTLFAGSFTGGGLSRSTNSGDSWTILTNGLPTASCDVYSIAIDPSAPQNVYAGVEAKKGVYKSSDGGDSWVPVNTGLPANTTVDHLAAHPAASGTIYAGFLGGGIYKTTNGGTQWIASSAGLPAGKTIEALVIDPNTPSTLYLTTFDTSAQAAGVFRSTNGGGNWTSIAAGLPPNGSIRALLVPPGFPGAVYAGTAKGIYRSLDGGAHWTPSSSGLPAFADVTALAYDPGATPGRALYATTQVGAYAVDLASSPAAFYAGVSGWIYQSVDGGNTWREFNRGFANGATPDPVSPHVNGLAVAFSRLAPVALAVDPIAGSGSNGNGVFEPGETVLVQPSWKNLGGASVALGGQITDPGALDPTDDAASYGTVAAGASASCTAAANCYSVFHYDFPRESISGHIDSRFTETLTSSEAPKDWVVHIGNSFTDVATAHPFYKKIETVYHHGVTLGCSNILYCPSEKVPRDQMAIFLARGLAGGGPNVPAAGTVGGAAYNCVPGGTSLFADVLSEDIFCKSVHYLAAQNVTAGCSAGNYCPGDLISRASMAIFVAKAMVAPGGGAAVPQTYGPDPVTGLSYSCSAAGPKLHFKDIKISDSFCKHAHYLWARGAISGCGTDQYCPSGEVGRDEMAKFLSNAFGLTLYGP